MFEKYSFKKCEYDWNQIESKLKGNLPNSYKTFYETIGAIGIDDFIYIVPPDLNEYGLQGHFNTVLEAYNVLKKWLDEEKYITFFNEDKGWLPVGYTTNGDFLFVNEKSVLLTDSAFEEQEVFEVDLLSFVELYLKNTVNSNIFPEDIRMEEHTIEILKKESIGYM